VTKKDSIREQGPGSTTRSFVDPGSGLQELALSAGPRSYYEALKFLRREWEFGLIADDDYVERKKAILSRL
jgi:hypothetical protein